MKNSGNSDRQYFWSPKSLQSWNQKMLAPWKKSYDQPRQLIKKKRHYFVSKGLSSQSFGFSSSHVWMWELDYKESWALNNWCFWTVVLEKTLEGPLHCKEIQPVHPKGNQSWIFTGRTDAEAETPILWPPDVKNWLICKDPDAGKDWRWEKGTAEDDGWMASPTQWTWVWINFRSWWWTGRPGMLQSMGLQSRTWLSHWTELRLVITFLPRSKCLFISWLQSQSAVILEPPKNKVCHCFCCFPIYLPWSDGTRYHDPCFLSEVLSQIFHSALSLSSRGSLVLLHFLP